MNKIEKLSKDNLHKAFEIIDELKVEKLKGKYWNFIVETNIKDDLN